MSDYIKREDAYRRLTKYYHHTREIQHESLRIALNGIPSADVTPVRHGRWIRIDYYRTICSVCEVDESDFIHGTEDWFGCGESKFCPNCGAKMDEEEE